MSDRDVPSSGTPHRQADLPAASARVSRPAGAHDLSSEDDMAVPEIVEALRAPARPAELESLDPDVAAFLATRREVMAAPLAVSALGTTTGRRLAVGAGAVAGVLASVLLVGTAAAAYTGSLPQPLQRVAHQLVGAPAPDGDDDDSSPATRAASATGASSSLRGPNASIGAPAAVGLCRAFGDRSSTSPATGSTAYQALAKAAADRHLSVADYCSAVLASASAAIPPGQVGKSTPPGQVGKSTPPGQVGKSTPPGQAKQTATPSPKATPPGQVKRSAQPTPKPTPPGQVGRTTPAGQAKKTATPTP